MGTKLKEWFVLIIIILLIVICVLFFKNQESKWDLITYKSIPQIDLVNTLNYSSDDSLFYGHVRGFVAFDNIKDQPHDLNQYYVIEPLSKLDEKSNQIFSLEEIIAMQYLPPKSMGTIEIFEKNNSSSTLTLEDEYGNKFFISKTTGWVSMKDVTGDSTRLITNQSDFGNFMRNFLK